MNDFGYTPGSNRPNSNDLQMLNASPVNDKRRLKAVVFTSVMLLAVAVAAYSLIYKENNGASSCETSSPDYGGIYGTPALADELGIFEFAIIALWEAGMEFPEEMNDAVVEVAATAKAGGVRTGIVRLNPDDDRFTPVVEQYMIERFPAAIVLGLYSYAVFYQDEISEESLMKAYEQAMSENVESVSEKSMEEEI